MSNTTNRTLSWHPLPASSTGAVCNVYLLQAGSLNIPTDLTLLPGPNEPNDSVKPRTKPFGKSKDMIHIPDYVFLIQHLPSNQHYIFDLGMRKDLESLPPLLRENVLKTMDCFPESPAELLKKYGSDEQLPERIRAVIFSHLHFDHVGDGAKAGFTNAELWVGPTACTYARPGYPADEKGAVLSENLPSDGSRKIVESFIPDHLLEEAGDKRLRSVKKGKEEGKYEAVELKHVKWVGVGAFDRVFDVFEDGSAYLIDAPGHTPGHQMMLIRVKTHDADIMEDDFVLLAGDCFHHPALLKDPRRMARPPYSKHSMHSEPDIAIETINRTRAFAEKSNVWVTGAHDFTIGESIASGKDVEGLVLLNNWRERGWKDPPSSHL